VWGLAAPKGFRYLEVPARRSTPRLLKLIRGSVI